MFTFQKQYSGPAEDDSDRQYYGAKLKLRRHESSENQPSNPVEPDPEITACVEARHLSFHYKSSNPILNDINLTVPKGKIYALLGASGCGKTTLLRMILGQRKPLSGTVMVFGQQPGTPESRIPGPGVGYMPQDLALFHLLSIEENLVYYGSLYGLSRSTVDKDVKRFIELLDLPDKKRIVGRLSGGQQRRVSLAVAMIHRPPLLILDEPTVGVDPLLRQKIWNYLENLCAQHGITVMLTTHYTEEAIDAYRVGFIYSGTMLAEDNPRTLLLRYQCTSLEDVFLELCLERENKISLPPQSKCKSDAPEVTNQSNDTSIAINSHLNNDRNSSSACAKWDNIEVDVQNDDDHKQNNNNNGDNHNIKHHRLSMVRMRALLVRNYRLFKRNPHAIIISNVLPLFQVVIFCLIVVRNLENIPVLVVNEEQNQTSNSLSNLFIDQIDQKTLDLHYYNDLDEAINGVHTNQARMVMRFPSNFSKYFRRRFLKPERASEKVLNNSNIELYADTSHVVFHLYSYQTLLNAFEKYIRIVGDMLGFNPNFFGSPVQLEQPIYGTMSPRYFEFVMPGCGLAVIHAISMLIGSFSMIKERMEGHLERQFVAGITTDELLLSYILFFIIPLTTMNMMVLFVSFHVFKATCLGSLWNVFIMNFATSVQGLCMGTVLSILCRSVLASLMLVFCCEMPLIFVSGSIWPIQSLPKWTRNIVLLNPMTLPVASLSNILYRGWSLLHFEVLIGLLYSISFTSVVVIFGAIYFRIFK